MFDGTADSTFDAQHVISNRITTWTLPSKTPRGSTHQGMPVTDKTSTLQRRRQPLRFQSTVTKSDSAALVRGPVYGVIWKITLKTSGEDMLRN